MAGSIYDSQSSCLHTFDFIYNFNHRSQLMQCIATTTFRSMAECGIESGRSYALHLRPPTRTLRLYPAQSKFRTTTDSPDRLELYRSSCHGNQGMTAMFPRHLLSGPGSNLGWAFDLSFCSDDKDRCDPCSVSDQVFGRLGMNVSTFRSMLRSIDFSSSIIRFVSQSNHHSIPHPVHYIKPHQIIATLTVLP